jgi:hypothetical protein
MFNKVIIFTPNNVVTGGTEAIHQLSHMINQLGGNCKIAYSPEIRHYVVLSARPTQKILTGFNKYYPVVALEEKIDEDTLVIIPEMYTKGLSTLPNCTKAIWWLSVNHALRFNPKLNDIDYRKNFFSESNTIHFFQSYYAYRYLMENCAPNMFPLFDYTSQEFFEHNDIKNTFKKFISVFPHKGKEHSKLFMDKFPDLPFSIIEDMTPTEVATALSNSVIYIDFGPQPGKDRVPREAVASNAVIFLLNQGAGRFYLDFPIPNFFRFDIEDIENGVLYRKVLEVMKNPNLFLSQQNYFRKKITLEKSEFELQVESFFFS